MFIGDRIYGYTVKNSITNSVTVNFNKMMVGQF